MPRPLPQLTSDRAVQNTVIRASGRGCQRADGHRVRRNSEAKVLG